MEYQLMHKKTLRHSTGVLRLRDVKKHFFIYSTQAFEGFTSLKLIEFNLVKILNLKFSNW